MKDSPIEALAKLISSWTCTRGQSYTVDVKSVQDHRHHAMLLLDVRKAGLKTVTCPMATWTKRENYSKGYVKSNRSTSAMRLSGSVLFCLICHWQCIPRERDSSAALCSTNVLVPFLSPSSSTPFKENTPNSSSMSGMSYSSYASILSSNLRYSRSIDR